MKNSTWFENILNLRSKISLFAEKGKKRNNRICNNDYL